MKEKDIKKKAQIPGEVGEAGGNMTPPAPRSEFVEEEPSPGGLKGLDEFESPRIEEKEEKKKKPELEELSEVAEPAIVSKLNPIDRAIFLNLEKQRVKALEEGDKATLEWIHQEEMKILDKYSKPAPIDELSGLNFANRKVEQRLRILSDTQKQAAESIKKVDSTLKSMGVSVINASLSDTIKIDPEGNNISFDWVVYVKDYRSKSIKPIIIRSFYQNGTVKISGYFYDLLGNRYSLDKVSLAKYLGVYMNEDISDEALMHLGLDKHDLKHLKMTGGAKMLARPSVKMRKELENYTFVSANIVEKLANKYSIPARRVILAARKMNKQIGKSVEAAFEKVEYAIGSMVEVWDDCNARHIRGKIVDRKGGYLYIQTQDGNIVQVSEDCIPERWGLVYIMEGTIEKINKLHKDTVERKEAFIEYEWADTIDYYGADKFFFEDMLHGILVDEGIIDESDDVEIELMDSIEESEDVLYGNGTIYSGDTAVASFNFYVRFEVWEDEEQIYIHYVVIELEI